MSATEATVASKPLQIIECIDGVCTLNETNLKEVLKGVTEGMKVSSE
jgi:hypothetical protein